MRGDLFDYLLLLVKSGVRFDQALSFLHDVYPKQHLNKLIDRLYHGETEISVLASLFPWWLSYPFKNISIVIRIDFFLEVYDEYIKMKRRWFHRFYKLLLYPVILLIFSIVLLIILIQFVLPFSDLLITTQQSNYTNYLFLIMVIFVLQVSWMGIVLVYIIRFNVIDFFEILDICFKMGFSLHTILTELNFRGKFGFKWRRIVSDTFQYGNFHDHLINYLKLPKIVSISLKSYSYSGRLSDGIFHSKKLYQLYFFQFLKLQIKWLQFTIYGVVLIVIFLLISILYHPLTTLDTL